MLLGLTMANLPHLPIELHVHIAKLLSLKDCIAYMEVCASTHDAVQYIFAHRRILDFASVLDEQKTINLPQEVLVKVLYAHSRTEIIINFCLNPSFNLLDEFSRYFNLYWAWRFVQPDIDSLDVQLVGHPSGHLQQLVFLGHYCGGSTNEQALLLLSRLWSSNQGWLGMYIYPWYEL